MHFVKPICPSLVAELSDHDYVTLWDAVTLLNASVREKHYPAALQAQAFRLMRQCGCKDLRTFDQMRCVAGSVAYNRTMIERLRAYRA